MYIGNIKYFILLIHYYPFILSYRLEYYTYPNACLPQSRHMNKINMTQIDYGWMFIRTDFQTKSSFFNNDDVIYFRLQNFALTHQNIIDLTHLLSYIDDIHMP